MAGPAPSVEMRPAPSRFLRRPVVRILRGATLAACFAPVVLSAADPAGAPLAAARLDATPPAAADPAAATPAAAPPDAALLAAQPAADPAAGRGQIRGTVVGVGGAPLVGVSIVLAPAGHPEILYATSSDEAGRYAFDRLVADQYSIRADGQGLPTVVKPAIAVRPPFRPVLDLQMSRREEVPAAASAPAEPETGRVELLDGRFLTAAGEPVVEGSVTLRKVGDASTVFYVRTAPDGSFSARDLPAGIYDIATRAPGLIPLHLVARTLRAMPVLHLRLSAPIFPLSFRGWVDDLLPLEVAVPPPHPRPADLPPAPPVDPAPPEPGAAAAEPTPAHSE